MRILSPLSTDRSPEPTGASPGSPRTGSSGSRGRIGFARSLIGWFRAYNRGMRLCAIVLLAGMLPVAAGELAAGAARREITPKLEAGKPVYIAGFGQNRIATGVRDPLWARCAAISTGEKP